MTWCLRPHRSGARVGSHARTHVLTLRARTHRTGSGREVRGEGRSLKDVLENSMASCSRCGRLNLPKGRDGRRSCRSCGPKPSIGDRFVAQKLGVPVRVGLAEYGQTIGISFAAHIAAQDAKAIAAMPDVPVMNSTLRPRMKARTDWMEDVR